MKKFSFNIVICLAVAFSFRALADGCEYDTQCKGERICENKICVNPPSADQSAKIIERSSKPAEAPAKSAEHGSGIYGIFNNPPANRADASYFCCTTSEKLGPYPNPGSDGKIFKAGDSCFGTTKNARTLSGKVCD